MKTKFVMYRSDDKAHLEQLVANSKLPLPFYTKDRTTKVGEVVEMTIEGDKIIGTVEHDKPLE